MVQIGVESENGWRPATLPADSDLLVWKTVPGTSPPVNIQVMRGLPEVFLPAWAADWNTYVEPLRDADSASYTPTNSVATSNHLNGTAEDLDWDNHPFEVVGTVTDAQRATITDMLDFYEGWMFWAGNWDDPVDEMHSQLGYNTWNRNTAALDFIARKIRSDGLSTYRRGALTAADPPNAGGDPVAPTPDAPATPVAQGQQDSTDNPAQVLYDAVPVIDMARAAELVEPIMAGLAAAQCTNPNRIAMFLAQTGEESDGYNTTEEYADGSEYEGRADLGNTQPGDGVRYAGRDFIQVTGRSNYTRLSAWAYSRGQVPTPTFFVDNPDALATDRYAFLGCVWYWTQARNMNAIADTDDIVAVTKAVNGGTNGLEDRKAFYARAVAAGDNLWDPTDTSDEWDTLMADQTKDQSRSIYRTDNAKNFTARDMVFNADATTHGAMVEAAALRGEQWAIKLVADVAAGVGTGARTWWDQNTPDTWAIAHAQLVLNTIEATNSAALTQYLASANTK